MVSALSKGSKAPRTTPRFAYLNQIDSLLLKLGTLLINSEPCTWTQQGFVIITANVSLLPKAKGKKCQSFFSCMKYSWGALKLLDTQIRQEHRVALRLDWHNSNHLTVWVSFFVLFFFLLFYQPPKPLLWRASLSFFVHTGESFNMRTSVSHLST